ncbi:MAG: NAD(P)-dependent oxidoreductase [Azospirillaceae bacterium]
MASPVVVVADPINEAGVEKLRQTCIVHDCGRTGESAAEVIIREAAEGVIVRALQVTAALMDAAPSLRIVAKHGAGVDNIDIAAASERGVVVANTGGTNAPAVAEAAVALMLATLRHVPEVHGFVVNGEFDRRWSLLFDDLWERTVGLVGCGNIGRTVARICRGGFGCTVLGYDPNMDAAALEQAGIEKVEDLHDMLGRADIVSVHTPLLPATHHLIDRRALEAMQRHAIIVNTSRGEVIDTAALAAALHEGIIAGAGIDVFEHEPMRADDPLLGAPNAVLSPHVAGATRASRRRSAIGAAEAVLAVLADRKPDFVVNPEAWERRRGIATA